MTAMWSSAVFLAVGMLASSAMPSALAFLPPLPSTHLQYLVEHRSAAKPTTAAASSLLTCAPLHLRNLVPSSSTSWRTRVLLIAARSSEDPGQPPRNWRQWLRKLPRGIRQALALVFQRLFLPFSRRGLAPGALRRRLSPSQRRIFVVLATLLASLAVSGKLPGVPHKTPTRMEVPYSEFLSAVEASPARVRFVRMGELRWEFGLVVPREHPVKGVPVDESADAKMIRCFTRPVRAPPDVVDTLKGRSIPFGARPAGGKGAAQLSFLIIYLGFLFSFFQRMTKGAAGKAGSRLRTSALPPETSFDMVAGIDRAKQEVSELVDMLRSPRRFARAGARLPSGVLLVGPPGTGKTLLARAVAAEAGIPFFFCSGSEFVEMFVGRGAARVRQLFAEVKKAAPAILFIDELDALGRRRDSIGIRDNSEEEQTLNQLLTCMDGLDTSNDGVVVVAATNRFARLDDALTRPGRFDRIVKVPLPDEAGREAILRVHSRKLRLAPEVDLAAVAQLAVGASGAELAALTNEAAIRAVRRGSDEVIMRDFADAIKMFRDARGGDFGPVGNFFKDAFSA